MTPPPALYRRPTMADSKPSRVEIAARATVLENATLREKVVALTEQVERLTKPLSELLAIIHRDGGHYQAAHGAEKAAADAATVWANLQLRAEAAEAELAKRAEPVADIIEKIAAKLLGEVNAPEQAVYRVAREIASLIAPPPSAPGAVKEAEAKLLAGLIRARLLGVEPDSQDLVLEDDDWRLILSALDTEQGWRPIETAPKDGTRFLAIEGTRHFDCWWHDAGYGEAYWQDEADSEPAPLHWQSLPPAPKQGDAT